MPTVLLGRLGAAVAAAALAGCAFLPVQDAPATAEAPAPAVADTEPAGPGPEALLPPVLFAAHPGLPMDHTLENALGVVTMPDLWDRIRQGFTLPWAAHPRVRQEFEYFAARPGYMQRVSERARPFLYHIVEQVSARGMPLEIALLPVVESAFQPFAYSHGRASGIWQFVPGTGRHFGLKQTWWYDGRRDVIAATDAALNYLEHLHAYFDGDWLLALAAYNAGEGNVRRAVRRNTRRGKPVDFWNLDLPRETEGYVPRLLAIRDLVRQADAYGLDLPHIPDQPAIAVLELDSQIDLALAAELAGLPMDDIYRLNPGYNRWATDPEGPHRLVLPLDRAEGFQQGLAATDPADRVQWRRHRVRPGQTLSHIAGAHRTTVAVLKQINGIRGHMIRAGDHLLVPAARRAAGAYRLSEPQRRAALASRDRPGVKQMHRVRRGDSLWRISRRYGVSVRQLSSWNRIAPGDTLRPGQRLVLWTRSDASRPISLDGPSGRMQSVHYTVRRGDSLYRIAERFNVTVAAVCRWNGIDRNTYLQPGQRLRLQVDVTRQSSG